MLGQSVTDKFSVERNRIKCQTIIFETNARQPSSSSGEVLDWVTDNEMETRV